MSTAQATCRAVELPWGTMAGMTEATATTDSTKAREMIESAKQGLQMGTGYLLSTLAAVPDEKLTYTPAETSKSPLQIGAHIATSNQAFASMLRGEPMPDVTQQAMESQMNEAEKSLSTREAVVEAIQSSAADLEKALDGLTPESIGQTVRTPFGDMPAPFIMQLCGIHPMCHASQIDYLQTTWGDLENHFGN